MRCQTGANIFRENGCATAHERGAGPPPDRYRGTATPATIAQALWMHGPTMLERMRDLGIRSPSFQGDEMRGLLAALNAPSAHAQAGATTL